MNYAFTWECTRHLVTILPFGFVTGTNIGTKLWFFPFFFLWGREIVLFPWNHKGPRLNSAYSASDPLNSITIHVTAALIMAISLGANFCPSNVYTENVSLSKPGILRGHNGNSVARRAYFAIHANHVCLFPSRYTTKGLISSIKTVLNSSTLHYGCSDMAAGSGSAMKDAEHVSHKDGVPPLIWGLNNVKRWWESFV